VPRRSLGFSRRTDDRVVAGVASGIGARLGVDVVFVRLGFVALTLAGGAGVLLYLVAWALSDESDAPVVPRDPDLQRAGALGLIVLGVLLLLRDAGVWSTDALVWPVVIAAAGSAVMWARGSEADRARWAALTGHVPGDPVATILGGRTSLPRLVVGGLLIAAGMGAFVAANEAVSTVLVALVAAAGGAVLVFGPWVARLLAEVRDERAERVRSEERATVAAHLHDSVLQTLALIQRTDDPQRMVALARRQERELRAWLFDRERRPDDATLRAGLDRIAAAVEADELVDVDVVVVGDAPADAGVDAVLAAVGEAVRNAARHAEVGRVDVYVEVRDDAVEAFVRDRGRGFDQGSVEPGRRGVRESIMGRMERAGGRAEVRTAPGAGTEISIVLPRAVPEAGPRSGTEERDR
jgi:signal transduction histidine kinase